MMTRMMVPTEKRVRHAAEIFGRYFSYPVEPTIYTVADRLSADYGGGYWAFWALDNQGFPECQHPVQQSPIGFICNNRGAFGVETCLIPMRW
ncbi:hypothetical protein THIOKS11630005 [Thiocapsa sp. KS1]|nr:hypothetical protein THIOKS11630005 [Thiocapsa sp. KS1]